jgi:serine/threonine protein kinase
MGVVWAATNALTGLPVAVKLVKPSSPSTSSTSSSRSSSSGPRILSDPNSPSSPSTEKLDARLRARFLREARSASAVRHPNVVQIYDIVELDDGIPMIVMELLAGESLKARLKRSHLLDVRETAQVLLPVVSAVGAAHSLGIVHRDLKPDNIFLAEDERHGRRVKVLDFGIAKQNAADPDSQDPGLTTTGVMLGTPFYMSPEQVFGDSDIDHRADVWALGVLIYECLTGVRPTQADGVGQVLKLIMKGSIRPLSSAAPTVARELAGLVDRMLSRERTDRPPISEVFDVLRAQIAGDVGAEPYLSPPPPMAIRRIAAPEPGGTLTILDSSLNDTTGVPSSDAGGGHDGSPTSRPRRVTVRPSDDTLEPSAHADTIPHDDSGSAPRAFAAGPPRPSPARGWIAGAALAALGLASWWAVGHAVEPAPAVEPTAATEMTTVTTPATMPDAPLPLPPISSALVAASSPPPVASAAVTQSRPAPRGSPRVVATGAPAVPEAPPPPAAAASPKATGTLQGAVVEKPPF